ncbi:MAG: LysM peptidoglycan-binding domain-containing protein [Elusimicrobiota bacterium]
MAKSDMQLRCKVIPVLFIFILALQIFSPITLLCQEKKEEEVILQEVQVKEGDTLWSVANYYLKDPKAWDKILKYNKLPSSDPNIILPGMVLKVPVLMIKEHLRPAYLVSILNQVKYRKKETIDWKDAFLNQALYNEDGLRTLARSRARIKFLTGELVHLDENSLVVVRPEKKQEEISLFSGAARASKTKVITDTAEVNPRITPQTQKSDFKTKVTPDKTTFVEVYEGIVDVTAQGKTVSVNKGFGSQVKYLNPPSEPLPLPPLPEFETSFEPTSTSPLPSPRTGEGISETTPPSFEGTGKEELKLGLKDISADISQVKVIRAQVVQYHLQIAKDADFKDIIEDETEPMKGDVELDLKKRSLPDGKYFYRISYVDEIGFESAFSRPRSFIIDTVAPFLEVTSPGDNSIVKDEFISVEGKTEPRIAVTVNNIRLFSDDSGGFSTSISAKSGSNALTIVARDKAGNETKQQRNVTCQKGIEKLYSKYKYDDFEGERELPKWISRPGNFALTVATFIVIIGVLVILFKK